MRREGGGRGRGQDGGGRGDEGIQEEEEGKASRSFYDQNKNYTCMKFSKNKQNVKRSLYFFF